MCTRAVGGLAHFFEEEGVATTQISLIRLHTELIKPPRALWVSFELGRPLGIPNDPAFQKRVLLAALKLLEAPSGPVLEDFPEDVPAGSDVITGLACPVNFAQDPVNATETDQLCAALKREITSMRPWYDMAVGERGRTTVGTSRITTDAIGDFICSFLGEGEPENPRADIPIAYMLKLAADDLKAYYMEGITAQPGQTSASSETLSHWFWSETVAGEVLLALREAGKNTDDDQMRRVEMGMIVPSQVVRDREK